VVAPLGTALTIDQARLLKRYAQRVILAFDADTAGEAATLRGIDVLIQQGLDVRVAQLPAGQDPDECVRALGTERFEALLARSAGLFDVLIDSAIRRSPVNRIEGKVQAAQLVLPTIAKVPDAMLRSEYVKQLAERLSLDEAAVVKELAKAERHVAAESRSPERVEEAQSAPIAQGAERVLAALVLDEPSRIRQVDLETIRDPALQQILQTISALIATKGDAQPAQVVSRLADVADRGVVAMLMEVARTTESKNEAFDECLRRLRQRSKQHALLKLRDELRTAEAAGQTREINRLLSSIQALVSPAPRGGVNN
jgi:DNA primase